MAAVTVTVELVDVDKGEGRETLHQGVVVTEVNAVVVVGAQRFGQNDFRKRRLAAALLAYEQRHERVAVLTVKPHPVGYHRTHPYGEHFRPQRRRCGHTGGKGREAVAPVPAGQGGEIVAYGVVVADERRVDPLLYVARPYAYALALRHEGHRVDNLLRDTPERSVISAQRLILGDARQHVAPQAVTLAEEVVNLHGRKRRGGHVP